VSQLCTRSPELRGVDEQTIYESIFYRDVSKPLLEGSGGTFLTPWDRIA